MSNFFGIRSANDASGVYVRMRMRHAASTSSYLF